MADRRSPVGEETQLDRIERQVNLLTELLTGNGAPERGLVVRVDRLEQQARESKGWVDRVVTAIISSIVALSVSLFGPHK